MTKIEIFKKMLNKGVTKIKVVKKKIKQSCDENQDFYNPIKTGGGLIVPAVLNYCVLLKNYSQEFFQIL